MVETSNSLLTQTLCRQYPAIAQDFVASILLLYWSYTILEATCCVCVQVLRTTHIFFDARIKNKHGHIANNLDRNVHVPYTPFDLIRYDSHYSVSFRSLAGLRPVGILRWRWQHHEAGPILWLQGGEVRYR